MGESGSGALYNGFKAGRNCVSHTSASFIVAFYLYQIINDQNKRNCIKVNTYHLRYFMLLVLLEIHKRSDSTLFPSSNVCACIRHGPSAEDNT